MSEEKEASRSDFSADAPKREDQKPDVQNTDVQKPEEANQDPIRLGKGVMPVDDEGLHAVEILGRCSKCKAAGWIDYPKKIIPGADIDKLLSGYPVKCFCASCRSYAEFVPMKYRIKKLPDQIKKIQDSFKQGLIR